MNMKLPSGIREGFKFLNIDRYVKYWPLRTGILALSYLYFSKYRLISEGQNLYMSHHHFSHTGPYTEMPSTAFDYFIKMHMKCIIVSVC